MTGLPPLRLAGSARVGIFVTVGGQMPFDRLVGAVADWAARRKRTDVLAQIGPSEAPPRNIRWVRFIDPGAFRRHVAEADVIVSHAGMGTILTALEWGKPIVVMPRRGDLRETRNDHQRATAERFKSLGRVHVAQDAGELSQWLDRLDGLAAGSTISKHASPQLLAALRAFVQAD